MEEKKMFRRIWKNEDGQAMVEYGLLVALIALVVVVALVTLGPKIKDMFSAVETKLTPAT
jgi:pilus assembly protein Flp/PilA